MTATCSNLILSRIQYVKAIKDEQGKQLKYPIMDKYWSPTYY